MALSKKYLTPIVLLVCLSSCSSFIRDFGLAPKYLENNKGKESSICLIIDLAKDTLYEQEDTMVSLTVYLKNCGNDSYFFNHRPFSARKDWEIYHPNSLYREFLHNKERCRVRNEDDYIMYDERDLKYNDYLLRPGHSFCYDFSENILKLICEDVKCDVNNSVYGEYQVQVTFVTELCDTIQSDTIRFWYLENRK